MAVRDIVPVWEQNQLIKRNIDFLLQPTEKVTFPLDNNCNTIIDDLIDTFEYISPAGIAANQINYNKRIFIGLDNELEASHQIYINPEIIEFSESSILKELNVTDEKDSQSREDDEEIQLLKSYISFEACLSLPGVSVGYKRYDEIKIKYFTVQGKEVIKNVNGLMSKLFQHELDHLNGKIIVDRVIDENYPGFMSVNRNDKSMDPQLTTKLKDLLRFELAKCPLYKKIQVDNKSDNWEDYCESPKFKGNCNNYVDEFCYNIERKYNNCIHYIDDTQS